ncbi:MULTISPECIES: hypothetical protein [Glycomyces]|uniref:5-methylcytosine-specific restriction protein A n=2 Tax=Glycomyces TaxID=58113 RepID=A0A9X3PNK8_9ACTN|nr:hypothetical protein [Glycomyces lechevalierae]MDA1387350.1 hypothetical protein [Glycomyces lechevalierae]MDR7340102.1 5-methylcytosine-specific restriction protein A [Glycomyces lechevalierae]
MDEDQHLQLGGIYTRDDLEAIFGGRRMRGIARASKGPYVLLYADPSKGRGHGYHDSLDAEEDELGALAYYSGEGQRSQGTQKLSDGNSAILNHRAEGRDLLLFWAVGEVEGRKQRRHQYVGKFAVDKTRPYFLRADHGSDGERDVYVFRLRPVGAIAKPPIDYMPVTIETTYTETHPGPLLDPIDEASSKLIELEKNSAGEFIRRATSEMKIERREGALVDRFEEFLAKRQHVAKRWFVSPRGHRRGFQTDLFDDTANVLYEAKGKADRNSVRMAIGQLFDYRRSIEPSPLLAILLPEAPEPDLRSLIESVGIALVYEENGAFVGWPVGGS